MEILTGVLSLIAIVVLFHIVIEHTWFVIGGCVVAYVIYAYHAGPLVGGVAVGAYAVFVWAAPFLLVGLIVAGFLNIFASKQGG